MISKTLEDKALDFLREVEGVSKDEGYQAAKKEFDVQAERLKADYEAKVTAAYQEGYNKHKAEVEASQEVSPSTPEPVSPEPQPIDEPVDDPVNEGYSKDKVVSELLAIKGSKAYAFGIVDVMGNVYANESEWILDGKPQVIGIGYTDGARHLCMHPKKVAPSPYGAVGVKVDGVYHTKLQWKKDSKPNQPSAYEDYSGAKNSDALVKNCTDSIAHKCYDVVFANGKRGYMPPCGELRIYCQYHAKVDELLSAIGGDKVYSHKGSYNEGLWSSTAIDTKQAWIVLYSDNNTQPAQRDKTLKCSTRVFVEL